MGKVRSKFLVQILVILLILGLLVSIDPDLGKAASKKIHLQKTKVTLVSGKTFQQKLINKNGKTIKATKVKWKSSKKAVATINKKGKVTSKKAGKAKVTAKYKGKTYKFNVVVKKPFKAGETPEISTIEQDSDPYYNFDPYIFMAWTPLKNAAKYEVYMAVNGGNYILTKGIETSKERSITLRLPDLKDGDEYSFKVRAVMGAYKSAFSKAKTIKVDLGPVPYANWLKNYILRVGEPVESDYELAAIGGSKCIKSYKEWGVDEKGHDVIDVYIISACNGNNLLTFGHFREIIDGYEEMHQGRNTTESTCVMYNPIKDECYVHFTQMFYFYNKYTGNGRLADVPMNGDLDRNKYNALYEYGDKRYGVKDIKLDNGNDASGNERMFINGLEKAMHGTKKLLEEKYGYTNITMKNLGFKYL